MAIKKPSKKLDPSDGRLKRNRPTPMSKTKKLVSATNTVGEEILLEKIYCRRCMREQKPANFYMATDLILDKNGKMSVCKDCIQDLYGRYFSVDHNMDKALLKLCRLLNWRYEEGILESTKKQLSTASKSPDDPTVPSIYRMKMTPFARTEGSTMFGKPNEITEENLIFREPFSGVIDEIDDDAFGDNTVNLKIFWGESFSYEGYIFLEAELAQWKNSHKADTYAEISLLKELCYKELEIRKARIEGKSTGTLVKEKQDLMKTASVDPAKANMASSGKNLDTFSAFIKTIEETEPAEFYKDKELFKDFDNLEFYFDKYVRRPLKNFVTGSRDFNVDVDEDDDEYEDFDKYTSSVLNEESDNVENVSDGKGGENEGKGI